MQFILGRMLNSLITILLVIPISILVLDVLIFFIPAITFMSQISPDSFGSWVANNYSPRDFVFQVIVGLGFISIVLEFFFPRLKMKIVNILNDGDKIVYVFFGCFMGACIALFLYTFPLFRESGWPYGSKENFIGVVSLLGVYHLFGSRLIYLYVLLEKVAMKLMGGRNPSVTS